MFEESCRRKRSRPPIPFFFFFQHVHCAHIWPSSSSCKGPSAFVPHPSLISDYRGDFNDFSHRQKRFLKALDWFADSVGGVTSSLRSQIDVRVCRFSLDKHCRACLLCRSLGHMTYSAVKVSRCQVFWVCHCSRKSIYTTAAGIKSDLKSPRPQNFINKISVLYLQ